MYICVQTLVLGSVPSFFSHPAAATLPHPPQDPLTSDRSNRPAPHHLLLHPQLPSSARSSPSISFLSVLPRVASRSRNPCFLSCFPRPAASSTSACIPVGLWPCSNVVGAPNQEASAPCRQMKLCSRHAQRLPGSSLQPSVRSVSCRTSPDHFIHGAVLASSRSGGFERQVLAVQELQPRPTASEWVPDRPELVCFASL
ncbi:uncharacterized protein [Triticum aestivum]|uniref:uncharacterized protein n=1 Tax=Triticum aestivum TaxID=4565 RepID=UPI001D03268D|nr:uncharacterized protein LOC123191643 [Triticum aestivum]